MDGTDREIQRVWPKLNKDSYETEFVIETVTELYGAPPGPEKTASRQLPPRPHLRAPADLHGSGDGGSPRIHGDRRGNGRERRGAQPVRAARKLGRGPCTRAANRYIPGIQ
jgi:hypothetical protein